MNRKPYVAPDAQLTCLAPFEEITAGTWKDSKSPWKTDGFFWKADGVEIPVTGGSISTKWYDFTTTEFNN